MKLDLLAAIIRHHGTALLRTDFSDDAAWQQIVSEVLTPVDLDGAIADPSDDDATIPEVQPLDDPSFDGATARSLASGWDRAEGGGYVLLADTQSMREAGAGAGLTLNYLDLSVSLETEEQLPDVYVHGRAFRCAVREIAAIDVNLSIANMNFGEFADYADQNGGVFHGF